MLICPNLSPPVDVECSFLLKEYRSVLFHLGVGQGVGLPKPITANGRRMLLLFYIEGGVGLVISQACKRVLYLEC